MPPAQTKPLVIAGIRGRDGSTSAIGLPPEFGGIPMDKCREAVNVTFDRCGIARKRGGSESFGLSFDAGGPFASGIKALGIGKKTSNGTERLWAADGSQQIAYTDAGVFEDGWIEPGIADTPTGTPNEYAFVTFEGLTYMTLYTAAGLLQVYDPDTATIRRTLMGTPAAPTVADTGAGAYAAILRYYRTRSAYLDGSSNVLRHGEAGASQSFMPSGGGTAARVTKPATVEDSTHWRVEVSLDDVVWYVLSTWIAVGTTTYDDSAATTTYSSNDAAPLAGEFSRWPYVDFLVAAEGMLIGATLEGIVYFSAAAGETSDEFYDHERVPQSTFRSNYFRVEGSQVNGGYSLTGLAWWEESLWVFQPDAIHRYGRTGIPEAPFRRVRSYRGRGIGTNASRTIVVGRDEFNQPALYWWSVTGPRRMTLGGSIQYLGTDLEDLSVNITAPGAPAEHGVYLTSQDSVFFWTTTSSVVDTLCVFDTRLGRMENGAIRGGWSTFTGTIATASCSTVAADILDSIASRDTIYFGLESGTTLLMYPSGTDDNGTQFQAYVDVPERAYGGMHRKCQITSGADVIADGSGTTALRLTISRDNGAQSRDCDVTIASGEIRGRFEDSQLDEGDTLKFRIGDSAASTETWAIHALVLPIEGREARP